MHDLDDETYKRFMTQKAVIEAMFSQDDKLKCGTDPPPAAYGTQNVSSVRFIFRCAKLIVTYQRNGVLVWLGFPFEKLFSDAIFPNPVWSVGVRNRAEVPGHTGCTHRQPLM